MRMPSEEQMLVSVVMGVRYRRGNLSLLERSVRSILAQTHEELELIICEDGSTAAAVTLLKALAAADTRVRLINGAGADTLAKKLNRGIYAARGRWIGRQDDDDASHPERFARQLAYLQAHPDAAFVGCQVRLEQGGRDAGERRFPERPAVRDFLFTQPFIHPALLFRREALEQAGGYCENPRCDGCEDYDLLLRLYSAGLSGANLPETCFTYTLPPRGTDNRTLRMRLNEVKTRWVRFRALGLLPGALPYVVKPVAVGLVPPALRQRLKEHTENGRERL